MMTRADVVAEAKTWLLTPYHHAACVKGAGVDCAYFLKAVFESVGMVSPFVVTGYPRDWHLHNDEERYLNYVTQYAHRVDRAQPGDVALFKVGRVVSHGAMVVDWPLMIHSYHTRGVCYGSIEDGEFRDRKGNTRLHSIWSVFGEGK